MKILVFGAFLLLIIVQWFVPLNMIHSYEDVLKKGKVFRFQTQPIDPSSPFIGRYVWLNLEPSQHTFLSKDSFRSGEHLYVLLEYDSAGFAQVKDISRSKPATPDYVDALFCLAFLAWQRSDYDEARTFVNAVLTRSPYHDLAHKLRLLV